MSIPDTYGRHNPAAAIDDQNVRKLPAFMERQDRPRVPPVPFPDERERERLAAIEEDLSRYIDAAGTENTLPVETVDQLDLVAGLKLLLKRLTYSEMKGVAGGLVGEKPITTAGEMADALEAWSSSTEHAA